MEEKIIKFERREGQLGKIVETFVPIENEETAKDYYDSLLIKREEAQEVLNNYDGEIEIFGNVFEEKPMIDDERCEEPQE